MSVRIKTENQGRVVWQADHKEEEYRNRKGTSQRVHDLKVPKCKEFADTVLGGRSIAYDNAVDVWDNIPEGPRRVKICRTHYKEWKKSKKDDDTEWT